MDGLIGEWVGGWVDGSIGAWMCGWINGWMGGWIIFRWMGGSMC